MRCYGCAKEILRRALSHNTEMASSWKEVSTILSAVQKWRKMKSDKDSLALLIQKSLIIWQLNIGSNDEARRQTDICDKEISQRQADDDNKQRGQA